MLRTDAKLMVDNEGKVLADLLGGERLRYSCC
jgi:hypothetical protein